jgi:hypothetical protein
MISRALLIAFSLLLATSGCTAASHGQLEPTQKTIAGTIHVASLDSSIDVSDDESVGFLTDSSEGKAIFAVCAEGDFCKVTGTIRSTGEYPFIDDVTKVVLVRRSP